MHFDIQKRCIWKEEIADDRLNLYVIFLITEGEAIHVIGDTDHYLQKNMLCFVGPNLIRSWNSDNDENKGYVCLFSQEFYNHQQSGRSTLDELSFFQKGESAVLCLSDDQMAEYSTLLRLMENERKSNGRFSPDVLNSLLHALISKVKGDYHTDDNETIPSNLNGLRLVKAFTHLYMRDINMIRKDQDVKLKRVADYAEEIGVSQNHLNDTIKQVTGHSAGKLMRNQLIRQATMCLKHSSKSISEIAFRLGFEDPSYFSRFYKNQTGNLPSDLRQ